MIEMPMVMLRADQDKACLNIIGLDESAQSRIKRRQEALASPLWIEAADALQTFAHRGNTNSDQGVSVGFNRGREG